MFVCRIRYGWCIHMEKRKYIYKCIRKQRRRKKQDDGCNSRSADVTLPSSQQLAGCLNSVLFSAFFINNLLSIFCVFLFCMLIPFFVLCHLTLTVEEGINVFSCRLALCNLDDHVFITIVLEFLFFLPKERA